MRTLKELEGRVEGLPSIETLTEHMQKPDSAASTANEIASSVRDVLGAYKTAAGRMSKYFHRCKNQSPQITINKILGSLRQRLEMLKMNVHVLAIAVVMGTTCVADSATFKKTTSP